MILSKEDLFSDKQAITVTVASTNVIDLGKTGTVRGSTAPVKRDIGQGNKVPLLVQVVKSFAGLTKLGIALQASDNEAFTAPVTLCSQEFDVAELVAGCRLAMPEAPHAKAKRYLRLYFTVTGTGTAGAITAGFTMGNDETLPF